MSEILASGLPIALEDLLHARSIESNRIEFKATWNDQIRPAVLHTICAFANDLLNLGGGYVVLGVREEGGRAVLPPDGLRGTDLERAQKEVRQCCERIHPSYQPLVFLEHHGDAPLLVIWAPGGDNRPYQASEDLSVKGSPLRYYVRRGPETIKAQGEVLTQLLEVAAKIPFDDRRNLQARIEDLSPTLVRRFLHDVKSDLIEHDPQLEDAQLYRNLRLVTPVNAHEVPRNVGLLFFNEDPDEFFRGARTEVVQFDAGGDSIEERTFRGPLHQQIREALDYLDRMGGTLLQKVAGRAEVERTVPYPYEAIEEALVNALYHRSYEEPPEPVKVYLYPDRMEIISYPGPVPGIQPEHFRPGMVLPPVPARNRRIGDFLKELRLAEARGTGIPKIRRTMSLNGSPEARFDFDETRTYFRVTLPVHPRYEVILALREASHFWVMGERAQAVEVLLAKLERQPQSGALATQLVEYAFALDDPDLAARVLQHLDASGSTSVEAEAAFLRAVALFPKEERFRRSFDTWRQRARR